MTKPPQPEISSTVAATSMFVEVLVVGIGSFVALAILAADVLGMRGVSHFAAILNSTPAAGVVLAFSYALGILMDRVADNALGSYRRKLRSRFFGSDSAYAKARKDLIAFPELVARSEYARSRMRICRGWSFNAAALTVSLDIAVLRFPVAGRPLALAVVTVLGIFLVVGFFSSWRSITATGYRKLAEQTAATSIDIHVPIQADSGAQV
ncbi:hypothetical protein [Kitasatospora griseola]|uniref:hypothetical protein n=1 Tax=Kitasatospora griseola TaxID=2064 RepID=UPI0037F77254